MDARQPLFGDCGPALQSRRTTRHVPWLQPDRARRQGHHQLNRMDGAIEGPLASIDQNGCEPLSTTIACVIVVLVFALDVPGQPGSLTRQGTLNRLEQIEFKIGHRFLQLTFCVPTTVAPEAKLPLHSPSHKFDGLECTCMQRMSCLTNWFVHSVQCPMVACNLSARDKVLGHQPDGQRCHRREVGERSLAVHR